MGTEAGSTQFSPLTIALAGLGGGLAGAVPTPTSTSSSGSGTTTSFGSSATDASSTQQLLDLLNTLNKVYGQSNTSQTTTPNLSPESQGYISNLMNRFSSLTAPSLGGYEATQAAGINRNSDIQRQAVNNIMATRGLSTSPVAATSEANIDANRLSQLNALHGQVPLLQQQYNLQNLNAAGGLASLIPAISGSTTSGATSNQQTSGTTQEHQQFQNAQAQTSSNQAGQQTTTQQQQQQQKSGGGIGGAIGGLMSSVLPLLLSDKRLKKEIQPIDKAIDKIRELRPSSWKWKGGETKDLGFIAQDVEQILPELVHIDTSHGVELKKINYAGMIPLLVDAVKDLDKRVGA